MTGKMPPHTEFQLQLDQELLQDAVIHRYVKQELIVTTVDKLNLRLINHQQALKAKRDWITPFGVFLSLLATLITADFRNFLSISSEVWNALFIFALIASVIWLSYSLLEVVKFRNEGGIEKFINSLRDDVEDTNTQQLS